MINCVRHTCCFVEFAISFITSLNQSKEFCSLVTQYKYAFDGEPFVKLHSLRPLYFQMPKCVIYFMEQKWSSWFLVNAINITHNKKKILIAKQKKLTWSLCCDVWTPLATSLRMLMKGVAPMPRPISTRMSYFTWSWEAEP